MCLINLKEQTEKDINIGLINPLQLDFAPEAKQQKDQRNMSKALEELEKMDKIDRSTKKTHGRQNSLIRSRRGVIGRSMLDVHQFLFRSDWTLAARGHAYMNIIPIKI